MKELDAGHHYALDLLDCGDNAITSIRFVKRMGQKYPGNTTAYPGTNIQEVLRAVIARIKYLDRQLPCVENKSLLRHLRDCIRLLEERAAESHDRNPDERLSTKYGSTNREIECLPTCKKCGHIGCPEEVLQTNATETPEIRRK
jgi:hypothetical protein